MIAKLFEKMIELRVYFDARNASAIEQPSRQMERGWGKLLANLRHGAHGGLPCGLVRVGRCEFSVFGSLPRGGDHLVGLVAVFGGKFLVCGNHLGRREYLLLVAGGVGRGSGSRSRLNDSRLEGTAVGGSVGNCLICMVQIEGRDLEEV